jgi:Uma2 family endonuclease
MYGSDMRVCIAEHRLICYPDITIVCGKPEFLPDDPHTITNPVVIVEVLSPSTESSDCVYKTRMFRETRSLMAYMLVAQRPVDVEYCERKHDGAGTQLTDRGAVIRIAPLGIELELSEIYLDVLG